MSLAAATPVAVPAREGPGKLPAAVVALVVLSSIALLVIAPEPLLAVVPAVVAFVLWLPWRLPLRHSALAFLFAMMATESIGDFEGRWKSPLAVVGWLLHNNLNLTLPIGALRFAGVDLIVVYLGVIAMHRRSVHATVDRNVVPPPRMLTHVVLGSFFALLGLSAYGVARGGSSQQIPWQLHQLFLVAPLYLVFSVSLRGSKDLRAVAKAVIAAALVRAVLAVYVRKTLGLDYEVMATATNHADSTLFCAAFSLLVIQLFEKTTRAHLLACLLVLPPLTLGMISNNRRLVWVEVGMSLILLLSVSRRTPAKRFVLRSLVVLLPVGALYVAAGWNNPTGVFKPVKTVRSVVDSKSDSSTATRDVENYNLLFTARQNNPLLGTGFGHEYIESVKMDDISKFFAQYKYIPHNSILGLWTFSGVLGFTFILWPLAAGVYLAMRTYRQSSDWFLRTGAFVCLATVLVYLAQGYGDMGIVSWNGSLLLALALAFAGKLAVESGAWWSPLKRTGPVPDARLPVQVPLPTTEQNPFAAGSELDPLAALQQAP